MAKQQESDSFANAPLADTMRESFGLRQGVRLFVATNLPSSPPAYLIDPHTLRRGLVALAFFAVLGLLYWHARVYFWLCDDAYISFRYARNLKDGYGLVFNRGEPPVEGYTNFLWVLELAGLWKAFDIGPETGAILLSVLFTAGTLLVTALFFVHSPFPAARWLGAWAALAYLATNRSFSVWCTSGLETRQFTFLVVLGIYLLGRWREGTRYLMGASFVLAAAEYTRPEALLLFAACAIWYVVDAAHARRFDVNALGRFLLPFVALVAVHFVFRAVYYGDLLPNTYYAKHVRPWPDAGLCYWTLAICENGLYLSVPLAILGLVARLAFARDAVHVLSALCVLPHAAYLVRLGGDHFEFRPLDFYWPLIAVAAIEGIVLLAYLTEGALRSRLGDHALFGGRLVFSLFFAALLTYTAVLQLARYCNTYEYTTREETFRLFVPVTEETFPAAFLLPVVPHLLPAYNAAGVFCATHSIAASQLEHKCLWQYFLAQWGPYRALQDSSLIPPDAKMATEAVGIMPFFLPDVRVVDLFGLTDRHVARQPVNRPNRRREMAHDRQADATYLERAGVNVYILPAARSQREALARAEYALKIHEDLWMPFATEHESWVREAFRGREVYRLTVTQTLGDFEHSSLDGWTVSGTAMEHQPRTGGLSASPHAPVGHVNEGLLSTYNPLTGDWATGTAESPPFRVGPNSAIQFLFGGGGEQECGVVLLADGQVVAQWHPFNAARLDRITWFLDEHVGQTLHVRAFDLSNRKDGHILLDHVVVVTPTKME